MLWQALRNLSDTEAQHGLEPLRRAAGKCRTFGGNGPWWMDIAALTGFVRLLESGFAAVVKVQNRFFSRAAALMNDELSRSGIASAQGFAEDRG